MIYLYKYNGRKCCYDSKSGAVIELTALQYKMMGAIEAPLTPACPTSLRYELAKFDSEDVSEAYDELYGLFSDGILFAEGDGNTAVLRVSGDHSTTDADEADLIFSFAKSAGIAKYRIVGDPDPAIANAAEKNDLTA
ncbi:MAG: hypothetical protein IJC32_00820 [Clostridia bacterium]|nr:hypothetical protein [Clostridia bacterium]